MFKLKLSEKPQKYYFGPGTKFKDAKEHLIMLENIEHNNALPGHRTFMSRGASWTEVFLTEMFDKGIYQYLGKN